jgi:hypothetical protein
MASQRRPKRALRGKLGSPGDQGWPDMGIGFGSRCGSAGPWTGDAVVGAEASQAVKARRFRAAGGIPPSTRVASTKPSSGVTYRLRRGDLAILRARSAGVREIPSSCGVQRRRFRGSCNAATYGSGLNYRARTAQRHAERAGPRPKPAKRAARAALQTYLQDRGAGAIATPIGSAILDPAVSWKVADTDLERIGDGPRHGARRRLLIA